MEDIKRGDIKNSAVFLIFVLFISSPAYAETVSKEIMLSEGRIMITVNYERGDDIWANDTLNLITDSFRLIEEVSGVPYPVPQSANPYADKDDLKASIKICELTDKIKKCEKGMGIAKTQDRITTIRQIANMWNTDANFKNDWLMQGHISLYTYLVLKEINQKDAEEFKSSLFLSYSNLKLDFPLDEWFFLESVTSERQINKKNYGIAKSYVFMHLLYKNYPAEITNTRKILNERRFAPNSTDYKEILENETGENLDDLFSGWVFPGEYKVLHEEIKETELALQKYNEVLEIYMEDPMLWVPRDELTDYGICVKVAIDPKKECKLKTPSEIMELYTKIYNESDIKGSIEYADELIEKYEILKVQRIESAKNLSVSEEISAEENLTEISRDKYNEAEKLYEEGGIFMGIGLIFYDAKTNLERAETELANGNSGVSKEYSERAISDMKKAKMFGMVIVAVILLIFFVFLAGVFLRR